MDGNIVPFVKGSRRSSLIADCKFIHIGDYYSNVSTTPASPLKSEGFSRVGYRDEPYLLFCDSALQ